METKTPPNIKILVACHKADPNIRHDDIYMPIQVGKDLHPDIDLGFQCDNTGDNISDKNASYCELTAIYWAWKNLKDIDYIGLCHYRRYFDFTKKPYLKQEQINITSEQFKNMYTQLIPNIKWNKIDAILAASQPYTDSIINVHINNLNYIDFCLLEKVILTKYPEYKSSIWKVWYKTQNVPQRNMFLMKWNIFDKYCSFLFDILGEVEKYAKISSYVYYSRLFGFLSEIVLPLFLFHNRYSVEQRQILFISEDMNNDSKSKILCRNIYNKLRFVFNTLPVNKLNSTLRHNILKREFPTLFQ